MNTFGAAHTQGCPAKKVSGLEQGLGFWGALPGHGRRTGCGQADVGIGSTWQVYPNRETVTSVRCQEAQLPFG